ncbi:MAG: hypothetical protein LUE99_14170 [Bacteroides sp.]|nr:hypothetical protein [Bacteroides sp.]
MYCKVLIIIGIISTLSCRMNAQMQALKTPFPEMTGNAARETVLYFRFDRSTVDYGYHNNRKVLSSLHELLSNRLWAARIDSIRVCTYSSPEGNAVYNSRLAVKRAYAVKSYLVWKYPYLDQHRIRTYAHAKQWDALQNIVENDQLIPCRNEILQILALNATDTRKEQLLKS